MRFRNQLTPSTKRKLKKKWNKKHEISLLLFFFLFAAVISSMKPSRAEQSMGSVDLLQQRSRDPLQRPYCSTLIALVLPRSLSCASFFLSYRFFGWGMSGGSSSHEQGLSTELSLSLSLSLSLDVSQLLMYQTSRMI